MPHERVTTVPRTLAGHALRRSSSWNATSSGHRNNTRRNTFLRTPSLPAIVDLTSIALVYFVNLKPFLLAYCRPIVHRLKTCWKTYQAEDATDTDLAIAPVKRYGLGNETSCGKDRNETTVTSQHAA